MSTTSPASRAAVVYNPVKVDERSVRSAAEDRAARHGWRDLLLLPTTAQDPGEGMAREAVEAGVGLVVAVGGDGTVRAVATGIGTSGVPMGIVPRGTGNLLARNLAIPLDDLDAAFAVAMGGRTRSVDSGSVTYTDSDGDEHDELFLVMLGAGMDADMIAGTDDRLKARVGWPAYVSAFVNTVLSGHRIKVEYAVDGSEPRFSHTRTMLVANCGELQGGMVLLPDAEIDDGRLDVLALRPKGMVGWLQASYVVLQHNVASRVGGRHLLPRRTDEKQETRFSMPLDFRQGSEMSATVLEKPAAFQIDGEDAGSVTEFTARIRRRGLNVRVRN